MSDETAHLQPPDSQELLRQLYDDNWLVQSTAAHKLIKCPDLALTAIARFFDLSLDANAALRAVCRVAIEKMKAAAVPFLLEQTQASEPARRENAIQLLSWAGRSGGEPHKFSTQSLGLRNAGQPDWGDRVEEVLQACSHALSDSDFSVRFAAASVLEDCNRLIEQTIPVFIEALSKGSSFQRNWAALRLGRLGPMARGACEALSRFVAGPVDQRDVWDRYAHHAAQVALERIGCSQ